MKTKTVIGRVEVRQVVAAAQAQADSMGLKVSIAVVDDGGHLLFAERGEGQGVNTIILAQDKARASALSGRPTKVTEDLLAGGRMAVLTFPNTLPVEGGVPLVHGGDTIGAVGVSGGKPADDGAVAAAGAAALSAA